MLRRTAGLHAEGMNSFTIRQEVAAGRLVAVRRGVYSTEAEASGLTEYRRLIDATRAVLESEPVLSHVSAAIVHGLPLWLEQCRRVHVIRPGSPGWRSRYLHVHRAALDAGDIVEVEGRRVTTLPRTLCDLGRVVPFEQAVAALDAGLRLGASREDLAARLSMLGGTRGISALRAALEFADGAAESPGESVSRVVIERAGLPRPELQVSMRFDHGRLVYRPDFLWREQRIVGEFDGRVKYAGGHGSAADQIMAEKRRERRIRAAGWAVIRWTWSDLQHPERLRQLWDAELRARRAG